MDKSHFSKALVSLGWRWTWPWCIRRATETRKHLVLLLSHFLGNLHPLLECLGLSTCLAVEPTSLFTASQEVADDDSIRFLPSMRGLDFQPSASV